MLYDEFKKEHKTSIFTRGAYMEFTRLCNYMKLTEIDSHLMYMKDIGIISRTEYLDLYKTVKEIKEG